MSKAYDYIVIGGGSAGCVVASRLAEKSEATVLLMEAGGWDEAAAIHEPAAWVTLLGSNVDWKYSTTPQTHAAGREVPWPRGKVIGGSSAINALVYMRGLRNDYERWALQGNLGWDFDSVLNAFKALEDFPIGDPAYRGTGGPLKVRFPEETNPLSDALLEAAVEAGHPLVDDLNGPQPIGSSWNQLTVFEGKRQSAAVSFLRPALDRGNLTVLTNAHVQRLVFGEDDRVRAVEFLGSAGLEEVQVDGEAIVCAGAVDSPKLLMLSGVGDPEELTGLGISPRVSLPAVGRNLHDHPGIGVTFRSKRAIPVGTSNHSEVGIYCKTDAAGVDPDLQFGALHIPYVAEGFVAPESAFTFYPCLLKPLSRGSVRLRSSDPAAEPLCDPNYLADPADVRGLEAAIELSREMAAAGALGEWVDGEAIPGDGQAPLREYVEKGALLTFPWVT